MLQLLIWPLISSCVQRLNLDLKNWSIKSAANSASLSTNVMSSAPGGLKSAIKRRANADRTAAAANERPASTRSAGAGGSTNTLLKLYTDEAPGLSVDPVVVMVGALGFIFSVITLHVFAKISSKLA